mgnify:CR=1 FL=1
MQRVVQSVHAAAGEAGEPETCEVWYLPEALSPAEQARALRWLRGLGGLRRGEAFGGRSGGSSGGSTRQGPRSVTAGCSSFLGGRRFGMTRR